MTEEEGTDGGNGTHKSYGFLERKRAREADVTAGDSSADTGSGGDDGVGAREDPINVDKSGEQTSDGGESPTDTSDAGKGDTESTGGSGSDGRSGDSGGGTGGTGGTGRKRGRHFRDCQCERCIRRREAAARGETFTEGAARDVSQGVPRAISWDEVFSAFAPTGKKLKPADAFAGFCAMGFDVAAMRLGDHWKLQKEEAKQLGGCMAACLETVSGKSREKFDAMMLKYAPWGALIITGGLITVPRYRLHQQLVTEWRRQNANANPQNTTEMPKPNARNDASGWSPLVRPDAVYETPFSDRTQRIDPGSSTDFRHHR